jgi:N-ethylmaleimide reductase
MGISHCNSNHLIKYSLSNYLSMNKDLSTAISAGNEILFSPFDTGVLHLKHRIVHPPLTRLRANSDDSVSEMMIEYYRQRATDGGLMITESVHPSFESRGYIGAPGIYEDFQIDGWRKLVNEVHAKGATIFMQISHDGRQSHVDLSNGKAPVAPSVVPFEGLAFTANGWVPVSPHRAIDIGEIPLLVRSFKDAAVRAMAAGFDGVELHNANGYLADTFLQDGTNKRTDHYGGCIENRVRFPLQLVEAMIEVWGANRVAVRISPSGKWGSITDSNPEVTFGYYAQRLNKYGLAYLHVIEPRVMGTETINEGPAVASAFFRPIFNGPILAAGGFTRESAEDILRKGDADLVAFGRYFTSNPDLPERFRKNLPLIPYHRDAFWGGDERFYIDFPKYSDSLKLKTNSI